MDPLWIVAVVVASLALGLVALTIGRRGARRHLFLATVFLGCAGATLWLVDGGTVWAPRQFVVVFGSWIDEAALEPALESLGSDSRVAFVRLSPAAGRADPEAEWTTAGDALDVLRKRGRLERKNVAQHPAGSGVEWPRRLLETCRTVHERGWSLVPARWTTLVVLDEGEGWRTLGEESFDAETALGVLTDANAPIDLFVCEPDTLPKEGNLSLEPPQVPIPAGKLIQCPAILDLALVGSPHVSTTGVYDLALVLDPKLDDEGVPTVGTRTFASSHKLTPVDADGPGLTRRFRVKLGELEEVDGATEVLAPGWHLAKATLSFGSEDGPQTYVDRAYVLVQEEDLRVEPGDGELRELGAPGWSTLAPALADRPKTAIDLLAHYRAHEWRRFLTSRGPVPPGTPDGTGGTLLIVEPTLDELNALDASEDLGREILEGLDVLVVGPPPRPPSGDYPAWLPVSSEPRPDGTGARVTDRTFRLYLCPDNSRLMRFPSLESGADRNALTPARAQLEIVNAIAKALDTRESQDPSAKQVAELLDEVGGALAFTADLKARGPLAPLYGVSSAQREVLVHPPILHDLDYDADKVGVGYGNRGSERDLLPGSIDLRLDLLIDPTQVPNLARAPFVPLDPELRHPNAHVVLFYAEGVPQTRRMVAEAQRIYSEGPQRTAYDPVAHPDALEELLEAGVHIHLVPVQVARGYVDFYNSEIPGDPTAKDILPAGSHPGITRHPTLNFAETESDARASVTRVKKSLVDTFMALADTSVLDVRDRGRILDPRVSSRSAPERHMSLVGAAGAEPWDAVILASPDPGAESTPLVGSWSVGHGSVVALGYSPFAYDIWTLDRRAMTKLSIDLLVRRGKPARGGPPQGWGVQRIVDLISYRGLDDGAAGFPVPFALRKLQDQSTLQVDCWYLPGRSASVGVPRLRPLAGVGGSGPEVELTEVSRDEVRGVVTLQARATAEAPMVGMYELVLSNPATGVLRTTPVYLNLAAAASAGRDLRERWEHVAAMSGGKFVADLGADGAFEYRMPVAWFVTLCLCLLLVVMFSPLARPWTAFRLWLRIRRETRLEHPTAPHVEMDAESLLTEVGGHPGIAVARRVAGIPAGVKTFEMGDSLSVAVASSLHPFTTRGRELGLPIRLPRVRTKLATNPMLATVLVDDSVGLSIPERTEFPAKTDFVRLLANLIAATVWVQSGQVRVRFLRSREGEWGPRTGLANSVELDAFLRRKFESARGHKRRGRLPELDDAEPDQVFFLLTDGLGLRVPQIRRWAEAASQEGAAVRLAIVRHPFDERFVGFCRDAASGTLMDRSEWTEAEILAAYERRAEELRRAVASADGRFVAVGTDMPLSSLVDHLLEEEFLG